MLRDTNTIRFTKMQGIGNDYIYVYTDRFPIEHPSEYAIRWSTPHTGIGSDGLVLISRSEVADFRMRIFNADGSEAMMCGNASRCIGKYVFEKGLTDKTEITLETLSGIRHLSLHVHEGTVGKVTVDMDEPVRIETDLTDVPYEGTAISMGNPHFVVFVPDVFHIPLEDIGPRLEHHPCFPNRTNVEFAQILSTDQIRMRVWERGSGITKACGTGACATAVAAVLTGRCGREASVIMDGGTLDIAWKASDNHIYMTGPAETVFEGAINL